MSETGYVLSALAVAVAITFSLRAVPFLAKAAISDSRTLSDLGQWLPLGAVTILAVYGVASIDYSSGATAVGPLVGVAVTAGAHLRWNNLVLSVLLGTSTCLLIVNLG